MTHRKEKTQDVREACIQESLAIIEAYGVEALSLREIARRLGVSHQAPYKHFPSRDHILAEIVKRAFEGFANFLNERPITGDPHADLESMGRAYLQYALAHPLQYRLMFGTPLPDPAEHPAMMHSARHAFDLLRDCLTRMKVQDADLEAMFVWSTMHGLASLLQTKAMDTLALPEEKLAATVNHTLLRIGTALGVER